MHQLYHESSHPTTATGTHPWFWIMQCCSLSIIAYQKVQALYHNVIGLYHWISAVNLTSYHQCACPSPFRPFSPFELIFAFGAPCFLHQNRRQNYSLVNYFEGQLAHLPCFPGQTVLHDREPGTAMKTTRMRFVLLI